MFIRCKCCFHSSIRYALFLLGLVLIQAHPLRAEISTGQLLPEALAALQIDNVQLASVKAAIYDPQSGTMIYDKYSDVQAPIASITKLMTALVVMESGVSLEEYLEIRAYKKISSKNAYSRIRVGSQLRRKDLLRLALMASENLAADNLAQHHPGGLKAFVKAMNDKALALGMTSTRFVGPTGLSLGNVSTAGDLVKLVVAASAYPLIGEYSTTTRYTARFRKPSYSLYYGNTNRLVHRHSWQIGLSKTGYLNEAGRCLVLLSDIDGIPVVMVLLDSFGKLSPIGDAGRVKRWIITGSGGKVAGAALNYERSKTALLD